MEFEDIDITYAHTDGEVNFTINRATYFITPDDIRRMAELLGLTLVETE